MIGRDRAVSERRKPQPCATRDSLKIARARAQRRDADDIRHAGSELHAASLLRH
jgi:hypothetical protein